jgi:hypothetical protein
MAEVLTTAGFQVHEYRNVSGCCALGFNVIVFCLATGEWSIRRLNGSELASGNGGSSELAAKLGVAEIGSGMEASDRIALSRLRAGLSGRSCPRALLNLRRDA